MKRLTGEQWQEIRERREAGESFGSLSAAFDIDRTVIFRRAKKEGWGDGKDIEAAIHRAYDEKANGVVVGLTPEKRAALIDAEAERRAEIERRHRAEWEQLEPYRLAAVQRMQSAHELGEDPSAKPAWVTAKIASEVAKNHIGALAAKQDAERKAHRLNDQEPVQAGVANQIILEVPERAYEPAR